MSHIPLKHRWKSKPSSHVGVDWSNPLTRDLSCAHLLNDLFDSARNFNGTISGTVIPTVSTHGRGYSFGGDTNEHINVGKPIPTTGDITYFTICKHGAASQGVNGALIGFGDRATLRAAAEDSHVFFTYNGSSWNTTTNTKAVSLGDTIQYVCRHDGATNDIWVNGTVSSSSASARSSPSQYDLYIGGEAENTTRRFIGDVFLSYVWNRALSDAEITSLMDNPYQILTPSTQLIDITIPAVGGATGKSNPLFGPLGGPLAGPIGL